MRLPFPERFPLPPVILCASVLAALQQIQGTSLAFTTYSFLFIVIATITFNLAGGFTRPSGSYVFFYAVLGIFYKAYLGEAGDTNLRSPVQTMRVFTGGISAMLLAVFVSRRISRKHPLLGNLLKTKDMKNAAVGCFTVGLALSATGYFFEHQDGSFLSAISQLNRFYQMAIIIGTLHIIRKTGGSSAFSVAVITYVAVSAGLGALSFSKEGMFTPFLCWLVAASSMRFNVRLYQIGIGAFLVFLMFHFFF